jgi:hypothetical protein
VVKGGAAKGFFSSLGSDDEKVEMRAKLAQQEKTIADLESTIARLNEAAAFAN